MASRPCDIVLEGGGVKGIGLVGALQELAGAGYVPQRVAGTSAGAIVGSLLAAGVSVNSLLKLMQEVDYTKFRDKNWLGAFGWLGEGASLIFTKGIYRGNYLRQWLAAELAAVGVYTFADLRLTEPWAEKLPPERRYKLVVIASDVSRGRLVHFPWDYHLYGLDPDQQLVADAVRASMSIPFYYEPAIVSDKLLIDGAMLSNFPVDIFDDSATWPTFGVKLSAKEVATLTINPVTNPLNYTTSILDTMMNAHDRVHLDNPSATARTIFVDTLDVKATDFDIKRAEQDQLYQNGRHAAQKFLKTWNFEKYQRAYPLQTRLES